MTEEEVRVTVDTRDGITIRAPFDAPADLLLRAVTRVGTHRRRIANLATPHTSEFADRMGREAFDLRHSSWIGDLPDEWEKERVRDAIQNHGRVTWPTITQILERRLGREPGSLEISQVRRWAARWRFAEESEYDDTDELAAVAAGHSERDSEL